MLKHQIEKSDATQTWILSENVEYEDIISHFSVALKFFPGQGSLTLVSATVFP